MKVSEQMLFAYVDGELDAEQAILVEQAMRDDPAVASAVAAQRALREELRQAFAPVLDEPVPERLLAAASAGAAHADSAEAGTRVVPLDAARDARRVRGDHAHSPRRGWRWPEWTALAASLALGVLVAPWLRPDGAPALLEMSGEGLVARAELAQALDTRLSSEGAGEGLVSVGLSFQDRGGHYCRTFTVAPPRSVAGLAGREDDGWRVTALGESTPAGGQLRLASSPLPPAILAEVDARLEGEVLDEAGERAAREAGWR